ncbi:MAG: hypothetical protein MK101_11755 [Phycisphaerales bacterium]|nr:hypothetical protein [Phycisphaerales bacterium]
MQHLLEPVRDLLAAIKTMSMESSLGTMTYAVEPLRHSGMTMPQIKRPCMFGAHEPAWLVLTRAAQS